MTIQELRQGRRDDQPTDPARHVDSQFARWTDRRLPEQPLRLIDIGNQPQAAFIKGGAVLRGRDLSGGAVKQAGANARFEFDHGGRDGRTWQPERIGGAGEAGAFDNASKYAEEIDTVQGLLSV